MASLNEDFQIGDIVKDTDYDHYYIIINTKPSGQFGTLYSLQDLCEPERVIGCSSINLNTIYKKMA